MPQLDRGNSSPMGSETGVGLLYEGHRTKADSVLPSSCGMGQCRAGDVIEEGRRFSGWGCMWV